jgi:hypothetical protein
MLDLDNSDAHECTIKYNTDHHVSNASWRVGTSILVGNAFEFYHEGSSANALVLKDDLSATFAGQVTATGIKFDASGEVLDDYEEGIYQYKIYTSDGNSGTTAWTSRGGYTYFSYVRVGAICHVQGRFEVEAQGNASTSNSHYVHFSLPFAAVDLTDTSGTSCGSIAILRNPDGTGETQNAKIIVHEAQGGTYCVMPTIDGASESWFMAFSDSNWEGYFQLTYRVG